MKYISADDDPRKARVPLKGAMMSTGGDMFEARLTYTRFGRVPGAAEGSPGYLLRVPLG